MVPIPTPIVDDFLPTTPLGGGPPGGGGGFFFFFDAAADAAAAEALAREIRLAISR